VEQGRHIAGRLTDFARSSGERAELRMKFLVLDLQGRWNLEVHGRRPSGTLLGGHAGRSEGDHRE
jgi:hypothetical protein